MKSSLIFILTFYVFTFNQACIAQTKKSYPKFSSQKRIFYTDAQGEEILELEGNVVFQTAKIKIGNAQRVTYNKNTGKVVVEGLARFTTQGKVVKSSHAKYQG
ncbi:hypothetical protein BKI52_23070 [marine bacterium AO1-C]|nr:hypothetical protein BKI52_23070 [marine bacterium AO1-C]